MMSLVSNLYKYGVLPESKPGNGFTTGRIRIAIIGASIVNRCARGTASGIYTVYSMANWLQWANARLGCLLEPVVFGGIGGNPIAAVQNRYATEVHPYVREGDFVYVGGDGFGNSITSDIPVATMFSSWLTLISQILADGCTPIVATCPPNGNVTNAAKANLWYGINNLVIAYAASDPRVILQRWDMIHLSPTATYPNSPLADGWTIDDTHPQPRLSIAIGDQLVDGLQAFLGSALAKVNAVPWHSHNSDSYRLVTNPTMSGTVGGVASNWTLAGAGAVGTKVSRSDLGHQREYQRIVTTAGTAHSTLTADVFTIPTVGVFIPAKGVDYVRAFARVKLNAAPTNLRGIQLDIQFNGSTQRTIGLSTGSIAAASGGNYADAGPYMKVDEWLTICTPHLLLPVGATGIRPIITVSKSAAGNITSDVYVSDVCIEVVPAAEVPPQSAAAVID